MPETREWRACMNSTAGPGPLADRRGGSARIARRGLPEPNAHDEAHLSAAEAGAFASFSLAEIHRWNPFVHLANLDLACYDREYARGSGRRPERPT